MLQHEMVYSGIKEPHFLQGSGPCLYPRHLIGSCNHTRKSFFPGPLKFLFPAGPIRLNPSPNPNASGNNYVAKYCISYANN